MAAKLVSIPFTAANVSSSDVAVPMPLTIDTIPERLIVYHPFALVTIPDLTITDISARLLNKLALNGRYIIGGGDLDFLVKLSEGGPEDVSGELRVWQVLY